MKMAGNLPPWLAQAAGDGKASGGKGKVSSGAISRRLSKNKKKKKKGKSAPPFSKNNDSPNGFSDE